MNANETESALPEKRVQLPDPDMDNITVLTRELPNDPILPWHHYDSPWLESGSEELESESESQDAITNETAFEELQEPLDPPLGDQQVPDDANDFDITEVAEDGAIAPSDLPSSEPESKIPPESDPPAGVQTEQDSPTLNQPGTVQTVPPSIPVPLYVLQEDAVSIVEPLLPTISAAELPNLEPKH